jgi:hypothetical protein
MTIFLSTVWRVCARARPVSPFWREAGGAPAKLATAFERELENRQTAGKRFKAFRN